MSTSVVDKLKVKQQVQLVWTDLGYAVNIKGGPKPLISGMSGHASPGQLLAVMGSSGAGKTTLLNVLSGRSLAGNITGSTTINGSIMPRESFRKVAAFVTQEDVMMGSQTPREILNFSAALRLPSSTSSAERREIVESIISILHLEKCANTMVGDPQHGGISGGERKRTNVGAELVTNPSVIFLDEPTSGLDAFTSVSVMRRLKELATGGRTVVATIHQPASEIFATFDTLNLLHTGGSAYFGPASNGVSYFAALGHTCPNNYNPADFLIGELMRQLYPEEGGTDGKLDAEQGGGALSFLDAWKASAEAQAHLTPPIVAGCDQPVSVVNEGGASPPIQFLRIGLRNLVQYKREKLGIRARVAQTIVFSVLIGLIFWDLKFDEPSIQDRMGCLFFANLSQLMFGLLQVVLMFPVERRIFEREHSAGYYSVSTYFLAKVGSETPFQIIFPAIYALILSSMVGFQSSRLPMFMLVLVLVTNCAAAVGFVIGCLAPNPQLAVVMAPPVFVPLVLTAGLLANKNRLDPYFIWLESISFLAYGYEASMINEFDGLEFSFNRTITIAVPQLSGSPVLTTRTMEVSQDGQSVLDIGGFDSTIGRQLINLLVWWVVALFVAGTTLWLRVHGGQLCRKAKNGLKSKEVPASPASADSIELK